MQQDSNFLCPPTVVWRHRKENLKKCTLRGLEGRPDFLFYTYPKDPLPSFKGYIMLTLEAPPLSVDDKGHGLFVIDATWRYAEVMVRQLPSQEDVILRSIPSHYVTAYPRRQDDCSDPERGLASVEAIYVAYHLMGRSTEGLLDNYYWKERFLENMRG